MTEHRGPDAKKVYSFRFSPNDLIHWRLAAESHGLTLTDWIERSCNTGVYDFAMALIDAGTYPGRRSKLMGLQAQLLIDARRKEDGDAGPLSSEPAEPAEPELAPEERAALEFLQEDIDKELPAPEPAPTGNGGKPQEGFYPAEIIDNATLAVRMGMDGKCSERPKPLETELAKQILAKRGCCVHGTQRGFHCWQCRGKAKIAGDPETLSKREQAKAEREQAKASKKKGKGRR